MTLMEFVQARIAEERAAIPERGDDPFLPYGQHWSEVPFPMASAERAVAVLDALQAAAESVANVEWTGSYAVRDVVLGHLAAIWSEHPDYPGVADAH